MKRLVMLHSKSTAHYIKCFLSTGMMLFLEQMIANILLLDTPLHWIVWLEPVDGEILRFVQVSM